MNEVTNKDHLQRYLISLDDLLTPIHGLWSFHVIANLEFTHQFCWLYFKSDKDIFVSLGIVCFDSDENKLTIDIQMRYTFAKTIFHRINGTIFINAISNVNERKYASRIINEKTN